MSSYISFFADANLLNGLLIFATGLEDIPPLGFFPQPEIIFGHLEDFNGKDITAAFPFANTCTHTLRLPVLDDYEIFKGNVISAVSNVTIFTDA